MEQPGMELVVSQQLKRLWTLLSDMDQAHVARLARSAAKPHRAAHNRKAA